MFSATFQPDGSLKRLEMPAFLNLVDPRQDDVLTAARNRGRVALFVDAVETLGWEHWFEFPGPMTYFIPSDDVFSAMSGKNSPADFCVGWLRQGSIALSHGLLDRYTAYGRWELGQLSATTPMLDETPLAVTAGRVVRVNGARVVKANIESKNGLIHVIDRLFPISPRRLKHLG